MQAMVRRERPTRVSFIQRPGCASFGSRIRQLKISLDKNSGVTILNHMVKYSEALLDTTFRALSDVTRRGILARLVQGETSVSELAAPYEMSLPAVSKHLRVLEDAGLVKRHKDGRVHRCRLVAEPMEGGAGWDAGLRQFL